MKVTVRWIATGNVAHFEETDDILGPDSTFLELKGFIHIRYGFEVSQLLLVCNRQLCDDDETLRQYGLTSSAECDANPIGCHIFSHDELEEEEATAEKERRGGIIFYEHSDFQRALQILGRNAEAEAAHERRSVAPARVAAARQHAPRARPKFLDEQAAGLVAAVHQQQQEKQATPGSLSSSSPTAVPAAAAAAAPPTAMRLQHQRQQLQQQQQHQPQQQSQHQGLSMMKPEGSLPDSLHHPHHQYQLQHHANAAPLSISSADGLIRVFTDCLYGPRREEAEMRFAVDFPGSKEPFTLWDMRPSGPTLLAAAASSDGAYAGPLVMELFYFGEFQPIAGREREFGRQVEQVLALRGFDGFRVHYFPPPRLSNGAGGGGTDSGIREAGCMYPLVAVPLEAPSVPELARLSCAIFEDFGSGGGAPAAAAHGGNGLVSTNGVSQHRGTSGAAPPQQGEQCAMM